ncbi:chloramphenicol acetyltransferase [Puniceicoccaceae bacterium K14]|nr:chloramphenicol acetyltransferase [Puniceicoccaceae bacterium K14]
MRRIDFENWERSEHFNFFSQMDDPSWSVVVEMDCSRAYLEAKKNGYSFFLLYLHYSLRAANEVEAFKYRIDGEDQVVVHDVINASMTVDRPDGTFGYGYVDYIESFELFERAGRQEIEKVRAESKLDPSAGGGNVMYYSTLPWLKFTSLSHASNFDKRDSIPRLTFGKLSQEKRRWVMPLAIQVNHALVDGAHVGKFVKYFQDLMDGG